MLASGGPRSGGLARDRGDDLVTHVIPGVASPFFPGILLFSESHHTGKLLVVEKNDG